MHFNNTWFHELSGCYTALNPTPLKNPRLLYHSAQLAQELGLEAALFTPDNPGLWSGEKLMPGMQPLAQV